MTDTLDIDFNKYLDENTEFLKNLGFNPEYKDGILTCYVSGGKYMSFVSEEKITIDDVITNYGEARFREGQDDIRSEIKEILKLND